MSWKLGGADWGTNALYPAAGGRSYNSGSFGDGGSSGAYWSASRYHSRYSSDAYYASYLYFSSDGTVYPNDDGYRACGYSVRCVRE